MSGGEIVVMVSSTINYLTPDRDAVEKAFSTAPLCKVVGAAPMNTSIVGINPHSATLDMAGSCDLFILLLGGQFGFELTNGISATEAEFDAAYSKDPTKILVFQKMESPVEPKQQQFIDKVTNYYSGYWRTTYSYTHDLQTMVMSSFAAWIKERAMIGYRLNYFDHFIRMAIQRFHIPSAQMYYSVKENEIEIECFIFGNKYVAHFDKSQIYKDFWGCISSLENHYRRWSGKR